MLKSLKRLIKRRITPFDKSKMNYKVNRHILSTDRKAYNLDNSVYENYVYDNVLVTRPREYYNSDSLESVCSYIPYTHTDIDGNKYALQPVDSGCKMKCNHLCNDNDSFCPLYDCETLCVSNANGRSIDTPIHYDNFRFRRIDKNVVSTECCHINTHCTSNKYVYVYLKGGHSFLLCVDYEFRSNENIKKYFDTVLNNVHFDFWDYAAYFTHKIFEMKSYEDIDLGYKTISTYTCKDCGKVFFNVDEKWLEQIQKKYVKIEWIGNKYAVAFLDM